MAQIIGSGGGTTSSGMKFRPDESGYEKTQYNLQGDIGSAQQTLLSSGSGGGGGGGRGGRCGVARPSRSRIFASAPLTGWRGPGLDIR